MFNSSPGSRYYSNYSSHLTVPNPTLWLLALGHVRPPSDPVFVFHFIIRILDSSEPSH